MRLKHEGELNVVIRNYNIEQQLNRLELQGGIIMATLKEVQDELETLKTTIADEKTEVVTKITGLEDQIKSLQDQLAAGGSVTAADLDALVTDIKNIKQTVSEINT